MREIEEEGAARVAPNEIECASGVAPRERRLHHGILDHVLALDQLDRPHVIAVKQTEVFVEAAAGGIKFDVLVTEMPLADHAGGVARLLEQLAQQPFGL